MLGDLLSVCGDPMAYQRCSHCCGIPAQFALSCSDVGTFFGSGDELQHCGIAQLVHTFPLWPARSLEFTYGSDHSTYSSALGIDRTLVIVEKSGRGLIDRCCVTDIGLLGSFQYDVSLDLHDPS